MGRHTMMFEKLSTETHAFLRKTVAERGVDPTARYLGVAETTIEQALDIGLRKVTRERLEDKLRAVMSSGGMLPKESPRTRSAPRPVLRVGGMHPYSKLTAEQAAELRARAATGEPQSSLARHFGISASTVWRYVHGVAGAA